MSGSAIATVLQKHPFELALRAVLAFGVAVLLSAWISPALLKSLLPLYEQVIALLDDHYLVHLALTHKTGHDKIGSDLVLLVKATAERPFVLFGEHKAFMINAGTQLQCSTATGLLMQPASVIFGLILGWPARSGLELLIRVALGAMLIALWLLIGLPLSLWIYFQDIPLKAFSPNEVPLLTTVGKLLLNGGGIVLGALLAAIAIVSVASRPKARRTVPMDSNPPGATANQITN